MQKRHLISLAAATVVLVAAAILALASGDRGVSRAAPGGGHFQGSPRSVRRNGRVNPQRLDLDDGPGWGRLAGVGKGRYPANAERSASSCWQWRLTLVEPKTQSPDLYPRLEVRIRQGKSALVAVKDKSGGTIAEAIVGKRRYDRLGRKRRCVYPPAGREPGMARRGSLDPSGEPSSWLDRHILDISEKKIAKAV
jgi:hypothetical protein